MKPSKTIPEYINISGFKLDQKGLRDRILFKRYFGRWEIAKAAYLAKHTRGNHGGLDLMIEFESRKKPIRINSGSGKKDGLQLDLALRFIRSHVPKIELHGDYTEKIMESAEAYRSFEHISNTHNSEAKLAEAQLEMWSQNHKAAQKLLRQIIDSGSHLEYEARILQLESLCDQDEEAEARYAYETFLDKFPTGRPAKHMWAKYHLHFDKKETESVVTAFLENEVDPEIRNHLNISLALYLSRENRFEESINLLSAVRETLNSDSEEEAEDLNELITEVRKLKDDPGYRRKQTWLKPLPLLLAYGLYFLIVGGIAIVPAISGIESIYKEAQQLKRLEEKGLDAEGPMVSKQLKEIEFGRSRITYIFNLSKDDPNSELTTLNVAGSSILFTKHAKKIIENPNPYRVRYLQEDVTINSIYPFGERALLARSLDQAGKFVWLGIIGAITMWLWLISKYKRLKFSHLSKGRMRQTDNI